MNDVESEVKAVLKNCIEVICDDDIERVNDLSFDFCINYIIHGTQYFKDRRKDNSAKYRERQLDMIDSARGRIQAFSSLYNEMKSLMEGLVKNDRIHPAGVSDVLKVLEESRTRLRELEDEDYYDE